jgi:O-antigen ligase
MYWVWLVAISFGQALFNRRLSKLLRVILAVIALSAVGYNTIFRTEWVSGWLPPLITLLALLFLWNWKFGLALSIAGGLAVMSYLGVITSRVNTETQQWSTFTRFETWPIIWELFKANPILGLGPGNYYYYTPLFFYLGYFVQFNSHNNFFDIALQAGLIGLVSFFWMISILVITALRLRKTAIKQPYPAIGPKGETRQESNHPSATFRYAYANSMLAGLAGSLVAGFLADWFLPFLYNIGIPGFQSSIFFWLFSGGLLVLDNNQQNNDRQDKSEH